MTRRRRPLLDVEKETHTTLRRANDITGPTRSECWAANTLDGTWRFERTESPGTPWLVIHRPTGTVVAELGSLVACRSMTVELLEAELEDTRRRHARKDPMTLTVVPAPTEASIRRHAGEAHGFAPDHIEQTTPALLLFEHDRAHDQFSAHKTPHRHHDNITAAELAAMTDGRLAAILEGLPGDDLQALAAAEAARRIRLLDSFYAAYRTNPPAETVAQAVARDDILLLAHAIAGELGGTLDPLASDEWQAVARLAAALDVVLDVAPRPRREEPPID